MSGDATRSSHEWETLTIKGYHPPPLANLVQPQLPSLTTDSTMPHSLPELTCFLRYSFIVDLNSGLGSG